MGIKIQNYCTLRIEGIHYDNDAPGRFHYQSQIHRHTFTIKAHSPSANASILKLSISEHYYNTYFDALNGLHAFGSMQCADIAFELLEEFNLSRCEVDADGNGVIVYADTENDSNFAVKGSMVFVPDEDDCGIDIPPGAIVDE